MLKHKFNKPIAIMLTILLSGLIPAIVTFADNLVVDGDNLIPIAGNVLNFGEVAQGSTKTSNVLLAIKKNGNVQNVFANGSTVAISYASSNDASLSAKMLENSITIISGWTGADNNTMTVDTATSEVKLVIPSNAAPGVKTAELAYTASGREATGDSLTRTGTLTVKYTIVPSPADHTPPTATHTLSPLDWTNGNVEISVIAEDTGSGLKSITGPVGTIVTGATAKYAAPSNGSYFFQLEDNAGNILNYEVKVDNIDNSAPSATHSLDPSTWTNGNVKISVTGKDAASGLKSITDPIGNVVNGETANYTATTNGNYSFLLEDNAGNISNYEVIVENIDKTVPTATHNLDPATWTNGNVKIIVIGDDEASGVKSISLLDVDKLKTSLALLDGVTEKSKEAEYIVSENGIYTFLIEDQAGNSIEYNVTVENIDKVAPVIKIGNTVYIGGETIKLGYIALNFEKTIPYTALDELSGFAPSWSLSITADMTVDTAIEGMGLSKALTVTDQAGNTTSITFEYNVISLDNLVKLLRPVEMDPTLNVFKKGSTIPIKLQLLDEQGMPTMMSASDLNFVLSQKSGIGTIGTKVKNTPTTAFRLSNDGYTYIYNLSTKGLLVGSHILSIDLESGNGTIGEIGFTLR